MPNVIKIARVLGIAAVLLIYALLVHHVNTSDQASALGAMVALAPILLLIITYALNTKSRLAGICTLLIFFAIAWATWPLIKTHTGLIFWMLDIGLMSALLMTFAQSLFFGRKPLCVHFAEIINGGALPPDHESYARKVTVAWAVFFAAMIITSTLLFFFSSLAIWSFFVNFLTLPLVAVMFVAEFMLRKRLLADLPTSHVLDAVQAYLNNAKRTR